MTRRLNIKRGLLIAAISWGAVACGQTPPPASPVVPAPAKVSLAEAVRARCQQEMDKQSLVGLSIGMARGNDILLTAHLGFEDREKQIPATDVTMYRWASISKPMTAVVAMQLAKEGKLDLDADVRKYVSEFPDKGKVITSRQLLCHQGGIVHYTNGPVIRTHRTYDSLHPFEDVVTALDYFKESPLVGEPGEKYSYTTHGYMLLGAAVQRSAGVDKKFATLVHDRIAVPLKMTTLRPDYQWERIEHRTIGYRPDTDKKMISSIDADVSWKLAGGGWISNIGDLTRFGQGMLGEKLVDRATRTAMWTAQKTRDGKPTEYGLGFGVGKVGDPPWLAASHSGSQDKTATYLIIVPEAPGGGVAVAVMCNTEGASLAQLARDLGKLVVADTPVGKEPTLPPPPPR